MDKNKKKTIATAAAGMVAGVAGSQGLQAAKEWYGQSEQTTEGEAGANVAEHHEDSNPAPAPAPTQTTHPNPSNTEYAGITEVVPVDTGGTQADVVIEVPQPDVIPGVDNVDPNEIAEVIVMEPEQIIDDGTLLAETHELEETELAEHVEEVFGEEEDEFLAEAEEEDDEESLDIDTI